MQTKTIPLLARKWLDQQVEQISDSERNVFERAIDRKPVSKDVAQAYQQTRTLGGRTADRIAAIGGSWTFIVGFIIFLAAWTVANAFVLASDAFDPYPFIFLNLVLSMIAALQAPVIMMSQNRQSERDRIAAAHDYQVNLKAEIEIMALHEKLDEFRHGDVVALREQVAALTRAIEQINRT